MQALQKHAVASSGLTRTALVSGITMRWLEHGNGVPVVLIHGIPTSPSLWKYLIPLIPRARRLAFEMVGYGESMNEGKGKDIPVARQADYVVDWLIHLCVEKAVFAEQDLGGVVQNIAVHHPSMVEAVFLTSSICHDSLPIPSVEANSPRIVSVFVRR